ncbi:MAG TPA: VOC family protein [Candidatus Polarisedimenticolia bacterium]|nr:VOC family protein [Candidatus Polarisedimenticolia bacterium]
MRIVRSLEWVVLTISVGVSSVGAPIAATGSAGAEAPRSAPFKSTAGSFFALSVADLDASVAWYAEKLGLAIVMRVPKRDGAAVAVLEGGGLVVELVQIDGARPLAEAAPTAGDRQKVFGLFKAGFMVDDFDRTVAAFKAGGVTIAYGPFPARNQQRANVVIKDNAGNLIQIFGK